MGPQTEADIYYLYMNNGWTISELAARYNVDVLDIKAIIYHYNQLEG